MQFVETFLKEESSITNRKYLWPLNCHQLEGKWNGEEGIVERCSCLKQLSLVYLNFADFQIM